MGDLTFSPQLFALFTHLVEEASGIHYAAQDRDLFGSKIAAQASEAGYETLLDYYYRLRYDDPQGVELRALVQSLVVHETYFFRELAPVIQLVDGNLAHVIAARGRARVWSAACSTGEEPLSVAMVLDDRGLLDKCEIVATDISESAVARARAGRHSPRSLREGHPVELAKRYLDPTARGIVVRQKIRESVRFGTLNLLDEDAIRQLGLFDVILVRNVLIYFNDAQVTRVIERLTKSLAVGGMLAVGVSESLLRFGTSLVCEERAGVFLYRSAE